MSEIFIKVFVPGLLIAAFFVIAVFKDIESKLEAASFLPPRTRPFPNWVVFIGVCVAVGFMIYVRFYF